MYTRPPRVPPRQPPPAPRASGAKRRAGVASARRCSGRLPQPAARAPGAPHSSASGARNAPRTSAQPRAAGRTRRHFERSISPCASAWSRSRNYSVFASQVRSQSLECALADARVWAAASCATARVSASGGRRISSAHSAAFPDARSCSNLGEDRGHPNVSFS